MNLQTPRSTILLGVLFALCPSGSTATSTPPGNQASTSASQGEILANRHLCGACHSGLQSSVLTRDAAPDLAEVGGRVSPNYLRRFLADPRGAHPGTRMPDVLGDRGMEERTAIAEALTHFLVDRSSTKFGNLGGDGEIEGVGRSLYHSVGCVACHTPRDEVREGDEDPRPLEEPWSGSAALSLDHVEAKYDLESLSGFLLHPRHVRPGGRMPDMGLNAREARAIASYLVGSAPRGVSGFRADRDLAALGEQHFVDLGCASCHPLEGIPTPDPAPPRSELRPGHGCLTEGAQAGGANAPDYDLHADELTALRGYLTAPEREVTRSERLDRTLEAMRCTSCHARGEVGGVPTELDGYFTTSEPDLGDEARIPPPLTDAGTRLQADWIGRVLFDRASVRPYMHTRMPQYGLENLHGLPELFATLDPPLPYEALPEGDEERRRAMRDAGRKLLGIRGGACVSCHDFNGKPSPNRRGLDLISSSERLRPGWFREFLISPQKHRPGIVMPESWPGGESIYPDLEGNTEAQIQAIWNYLGLGRSARDPDGIASIRSELEVTDEARTYRGRSRIAGFRGIAVGFPGGLNYAFDANHGSLAGIWAGKYVTTAWQGQGAGDFNPAARAIPLPRDLSFYRLPEDDAPWPLRPTMDEENPVNPDPTYPRNHGYRFRGYRLAEDQVPTFEYGIGDVVVRDTSRPDFTEDRPSLQRSMTLTTATPQTLWFRAFRGTIEALPDGRFRTPQLDLELPNAPTLLRTLGTPEEPETELLVEFVLPAGTTEIAITYALR